MLHPNPPPLPGIATNHRPTSPSSRYGALPQRLARPGLDPTRRRPARFKLAHGRPRITTSTISSHNSPRSPPSK
ncbi:hypothetical protein ACFX2C_001000 [Malus domestica]